MLSQVLFSVVNYSQTALFLHLCAKLTYIWVPATCSWRADFWWSIRAGGFTSFEIGPKLLSGLPFQHLSPEVNSVSPAGFCSSWFYPTEQLRYWHIEKDNNKTPYWQIGKNNSKTSIERANLSLCWFYLKHQKLFLHKWNSLMKKFFCKEKEESRGVRRNLHLESMLEERHRCKILVPVNSL